MTDDRIDPSVVVEVAQGQAAGQVDAVEVGAAAFGHVAERAGAEVAQQPRTLLAKAALNGGRVEEDGAADEEQVSPAAILHVHEAGPPAHEVPADGSDARR